MPMRKTAITVPEDVLAEVDAVARERGESRSQLITRVLREVVGVRRDAEVSRRLNEFFGDPTLQAEQRRMASDLEAAAGEAARAGESW